MAQRPTGYRGQGFSLRGEKDRFVLPPLFRKVFAELGDEGTLCVAKDPDFPCLRVFGLSRTDMFEDILDKEEENAVRRNLDYNRTVRSTKMWVFTEVPYDKSGRFTLPPKFCKVGGISDNICFLGGGNFITLWDLDALKGAGEDWEDQYELCLAEAEEARTKAAAKAARK
ncbi:division/cell wall cluster transcriptional repressor MraZ [Aurantiacibacter sp. D1-12]|uniref:division/cell wall cluster transcriptional repressor MraZ n=1 Tax=Aurantiacibacter sp. D1-12 TaxID=2993658 RepID=UPI00237C834D|nr:division/cell wall cluster transcriptional repressor MraZ [Aurantiacibacter sp. D1-12]MDE1466957.1 division/cell wall cluster transcriptional repressor MraZ [Aurantiacibacter sp. D1-12]